MNFKIKLFILMLSIVMGIVYCAFIYPGDIVSAAFIITWNLMIAELTFYEKN